MSFALSPERERDLQDVLERYPDRRAACIPALHLCQDQEGWLSEEVIRWVAAQLGLSAAHVLGVATFYSVFDTKPVGHHQICVCRTLSCALRGSDLVLGRCEERLGIHAGQTTADGKITLRTVECLASCGAAPVMQVDDTFHENLTVDRVDAILDRLTAGQGAGG